ncbi:uncharacterized protein BO96DRAFT_379253 [Aspergillus niger CBS 101883]|uniref:Uncharacterized protein n=3 Tax=Aspergillus niger TaxID=5061 RepID=A2QK59_ASPNC|nr:uncharacterized protein BO96DRAFT_379253 [Aspergillus niger CBS 101883]XP_059600708.1 hypothetical protein An04g09460 [Aspergillus niger]PYH50561.1 hypothetical protein BO96DRAFT_379253 [Aspergillus niger CBS 101883]RDH14156.1 hypothetical protein M747DRAFT_270649 [Aspergillus niger ATCC 13496]CAK39031.1 hypothetical protein An04g09460 [Aspergillus niger]
MTNSVNSALTLLSQDHAGSWGSMIILLRVFVAARDNKRDKESGIREGIRWDCRVPRTLFLLDPPQKVWQPGGVSHISIWSRAGMHTCYVPAWCSLQSNLQLNLQFHKTLTARQRMMQHGKDFTGQESRDAMAIG